MTGVIISVSGGLYTILSDKNTYRCRAKGTFRRNGSRPLVGDRCEFSHDEKLGNVITKILPRKNELIRPAIANTDELIVALSPRSPKPNLLYIDKLICAAVYNKITPVVAVTKVDLDKDEARKIKEIYDTAEISIFVTSCAEGEGVDALREYILSRAGKTFAFAGASGVGKSSLINAVFPFLDLKTGEISKKTARGKHTTRAVTLFALPDTSSGGEEFIADTPGFSMLDFINYNFFPLEALESTFPEFEPFLGKCRWNDCTHTKEDGCAITNAAANGKIAPSRRESYLKLYEELSGKNCWEQK